GASPHQRPRDRGHAPRRRRLRPGGRGCEGARRAHPIARHDGRGGREHQLSTTASFQRMWDDLAGIGRDPAGGYRRFAYTPAELELREWFAAAAAARDLTLEEDRAGN